MTRAAQGNHIHQIIAADTQCDDFVMAGMGFKYLRQFPHLHHITDFFCFQGRHHTQRGVFHHQPPDRQRFLCELRQHQPVNGTEIAVLAQPQSHFRVTRTDKHQRPVLVSGTLFFRCQRGQDAL